MISEVHPISSHSNVDTRLIETYNQIAVAEAEWLDSKMKQILPARIYKFAQSENSKHRSRAQKWMAEHKVELRDVRNDADPDRQILTPGAPNQWVRPGAKKELWFEDRKVGEFKVELSNGYDGPLKPQ